jgi:hypothetical protein
VICQPDVYSKSTDLIQNENERENSSRVSVSTIFAETGPSF